MIGLEVRIDSLTPQRVTAAVDRAAFRNLGHAAATLRKDAQASIKQEEGPSPVGSPPHTHTGGTTKSGRQRKGELQQAIVYDVDRTAQDAVIGPRESVVGLSGYAHELGEEHMGQEFPDRPFMFPALEGNRDRFHASWAGSVG